MRYAGSMSGAEKGLLDDSLTVPREAGVSRTVPIPRKCPVGGGVPSGM